MKKLNYLIKQIVWKCGLFLMLSGVILADSYDIKVNDDNTVTDQYNPRIAVSKDGNFAIVWTDKRNSQIDIYFQLFDSSGITLSNNKKLNDTTIGIPQFEPSIDANYSSQYVSVWRDYRNGSYPFNPDIFYSRIDTAATPVNIDLTTEITNVAAESPDIAMFSDGTAAVVWSDYRDSQWDIYGQRLDADGNKINLNFKINSDVGISQQHSPRVAASDDNGFIVVWYDNRLGDDDIYYQKFDSSATPVGLNIKANDNPGVSRQAFPDITVDGNNRFFITWVDWRNGTYPLNPDIYYRAFDSSGTAFGSSKKVNSGDASRAQKEVSIASDRMGNVCLVWADSASGQWDARAQIIEFDGTFYNNNFSVHAVDSGKQLQPDVAADGYKYYFAWADSRNGNYDIYSTIIKYNDPTLLPSPSAINITMEVGGAIPDSQLVELSNAGIGELDWRAVSRSDWLTVSPDSGITPNSFYVKLNTDTLSYGTYYGRVDLVDLTNSDSTEAVSVEVTISSPLIAISPDTLYFKVLAELGNPDNRSFKISNSGSGSFDWTAAENSDWLAISPSFGTSEDFLEVELNISGLMYDDYFAPIIISSDEANNSPETSWVHLELVGNMPFLDTRPDSLIFHAVQGDTLFDLIEVVNPGAGLLHWLAETDSSWIEYDLDSGSDYDTINITIPTAGIATGYSTAEIRVYDSASFNIEAVVPVEIYLSSGDTVRFVNANAVPGGIGVMPLVLDLNFDSKGGYIPFEYDSSTATLDSIIIDTTLMPEFVDYYTVVSNNGEGELGYRITATYFSDSLIPSGLYNLANLFFSAIDTSAHNYIDTTFSDSSSVYIINQSSNKVVPAVMFGDLLIGTPTSVEIEYPELLPNKIELKQNYPNPFNSSTTINLYLSFGSEIEIEIYNILGQQIYSIYHDYLSSGRHRFLWNGTLDDGLPAPTGIYFYRLMAGEYVEVRKMVLLK